MQKKMSDKSIIEINKTKIKRSMRYYYLFVLLVIVLNSIIESCEALSELKNKNSNELKNRNVNELKNNKTPKKSKLNQIKDALRNRTEQGQHLAPSQQQQQQLHPTQQHQLEDKLPSSSSSSPPRQHKKKKFKKEKQQLRVKTVHQEKIAEENIDNNSNHHHHHQDHHHHHHQDHHHHHHDHHQHHDHIHQQTHPPSHPEQQKYTPESITTKQDQSQTDQQSEAPPTRPEAMPLPGQEAVKECSIQRGKVKYHVTVVRGECCKPRREFDDRMYMEQRVEGNENSLLYNWSRYHNNNNNGNQSPVDTSQSIDSIFKQLLTGDPNSKMDVNSYFNNDKQQQYKNHYGDSHKHPSYESSDFETVFLLDRISKLETQLVNTKKMFQHGLLTLEQKLATSASRISFAVEQRNEQQKQQLQDMQTELQQQHKEQLDIQEKQQTQLVRLREDYQEENVRNTPCNQAARLSSNDHDDDDDDETNDDDDNNDGRSDDDDDDDDLSSLAKNSFWKRRFNRTRPHKVEKIKSSELDSKDKAYSLPLRDEPGRNENGLLNSLYASFTVLRQELAQTKVEMEELGKRLQAETEEKEEVRRELNGRIEQLWAMREELEETSEKNLKLEESVTQLKMDKEDLERDLEAEKKIRDETVGQLTHCLEQFHDVNDKYQNQSMLVNIIRSRMDDCITNQLPLHCEFEDERSCGFDQDTYSDHLDWVRSRGMDPSNVSKSRPNKDHTCRNDRGYYMTVLVTTRLLGQVARMKTPRMFGFSEQCIEFYYWISGRYVGTLNVYTEVPDEGLLNPVWRIYGNQGDIWIKARLNIPVHVVRSGYRVVFEGIVDRGLQGDIAIDDFKVEDGNCDRSKSTTGLSDNSIVNTTEVDSS